MQTTDLLFLAEKTPHSSLLEVEIIKSKCSYCHYLCDGVDDRGWGCGYRTLQSLCSWTLNAVHPSSSNADASCLRPVDSGCVPSLRKIQETLVEVEDKPQSFVGSREWIGSFEACIVLDHLFSVSCKIIHVSQGSEVVNHVRKLSDHFKHIGSPVMIGGDVDGASKTLIGIATDPVNIESTSFLIADPHYNGPPDTVRILSENYVAWYGLNLFQDASFYNFCLPQLPQSV